MRIRDLNSVISGYKHCQPDDYFRRHKCADCPYYEDDHCASHLSEDVLFYLNKLRDFYTSGHEPKSQPELPGISEYADLNYYNCYPLKEIISAEGIRVGI